MLGNTRAAVYPGTFDPLTNGHVDIIERAAALYETVFVAVSDHGRKQTMFNLQERVQAIEVAVKHLQNVKIVTFSNLLYQTVEGLGAGIVIRGLRMTSDFDYEFQMACMNSVMSDKFETVFLMARNEHTMVSSSNVKEAAAMGGNVRSLVPANVYPLLEKIYADKNRDHPSRYAESS